MTQEKWDRVKHAFEEAFRRSDEEREAYLSQALSDDPQVRDEVIRLLATAPPDNFLSCPEGELWKDPADPFAEFEWNGLTVRATLGSGGFGRVYRAWDQDLEREVALKLVPISKVNTEGAREAQRLAKLRHTNIVTIYGAREADGFYGLWMELIRGKTLQEILQHQGALGPREASLIGIDVCQALAAVHQAGLIHRDVKAQNVMREEGGRTVLMDFGLGRELASACEVPDGSEPLAGTPAYMDPELFLGRLATVRSDIYSVGVLLYHLVTNDFPQQFSWADRKRTAAASASPSAGTPRSASADGRKSLHDVRPDLPLGFVQIVERALAVNPPARFASAGQMASSLGLWLQQPAPSRATERIAPAPILRFAAVAVGAAVLLGVAAYRFGRTPRGSEPVFTRVTSDGGLTYSSSLSSDGKVIAFASDRSGEGNLDIWIQYLPDSAPIRLTATPEDENQPALSPDGRFIAYRSERDGGAIFARPVVSGAPEIELARGGQDPRFSPDGSQVAFWTGEAGNLGEATGQIFVVPSTGGVPKRLCPGYADARYPVWSRSGDRILFQGSRNGARPIFADWDWWIVDLKDGSEPWKTGAFDRFRAKEMTLFANPPTWLSNAIVFSARLGHSTDIWSLPVAPDGSVRDAPARVTTGSELAVMPWATEDGHVYYTELKGREAIYSFPLSGRADNLKVASITSDAALDTRPTISRNGKRLAFARRLGANRNVFVKDMESGKEWALTASLEAKPVISPDGEKVGWTSFASGKEMIYAMAATGGPLETLCADCGELQEWTPDGRGVLFTRGNPRRVVELDLASGSKRDLALDPAHDLDAPSLSPLGDWVVFSQALDKGRLRIFLARVDLTRPAEPSVWAPVTDGAYRDDKPRWAPDGRAIFFISDRDHFQCLWKQPLGPQAAAEGPPVAVSHLHDPTLSFQHVSRPALNLSVSQDLLVFNLGDTQGNIWVTDAKSK